MFPSIACPWSNPCSVCPPGIRSFAPLPSPALFCLPASSRSAALSAAVCRPTCSIPPSAGRRSASRDVEEALRLSNRVIVFSDRPASDEECTMATEATIDPPTIDRLAVRVCRAVRDVRGEHRAWIAVAQLADHLGSESPDAIDAAIAFAAAKGWLSLGGAPSHCVLLTPRAP